mgnify:CR=1 FL=1
MSSQPKKYSRRDFLKATAAGVGLAAFGGVIQGMNPIPDASEMHVHHVGAALEFQDGGFLAFNFAGCFGSRYQRRKALSQALPSVSTHWPSSQRVSGRQVPQTPDSAGVWFFVLVD